MVERKPVCRKCSKPVEKFRRGKDFRRAGVCYFESTCHGEAERVEYWPLSREAAVFVPASAFPSERPPPDQVSDTPPAGHRSLAMVQDELMAMPEWNTLARLHSLGISVMVVHQSTEDLPALESGIVARLRQAGASVVGFADLSPLPERATGGHPPAILRQVPR
jgi:hypothetical protein